MLGGIIKSCLLYTSGYAHWHDRQTGTLQGDIMDSLNGSRGIFEWLFDQATLFQAHWIALPREYRESGNYMEDVDAWFSGALDKLAAGVYSEMCIRDSFYRV